MPPKREFSKRPLSVNARPAISTCSLIVVPEGAVEGFIDRINTGIEWTLIEQAARYHREVCLNKDIPKLMFSQALQNKLEESILSTIVNKESKISLKNYWEIILPTTLWDHDKFDNDEAKICFRNTNSITDNMVKLIKGTCKAGKRSYLMRNLEKTTVLRLNDTKMTDLDRGLLAYKHLLSLNLCGNYIEEFDHQYLPETLKTLELHCNRIRSVKNIVEFLPRGLIYLGLARNLLDNESAESLKALPYQLTVLDMSDNDIYNLVPVLKALRNLPNLVSLALSGNPCAVCTAYATATLRRLPRLRWLDYREVLPSDRSAETADLHPDDLRSTNFYFTVFRVMSAPQPPKTDKGTTTLFHVELELPLLDCQRRQFLMFRRNESLVEMLPPPEDDSVPSLVLEKSSPTRESTTANLGKKKTYEKSRVTLNADESPSVSPKLNGKKRMTPQEKSRVTLNIDEQSSDSSTKLNVETPPPSPHPSDVYKSLITKNSREVLHYRVFESQRVPWAKIMNFQEPAVKIFCPDLVALRNTFRSVVTLRLVYTLITSGKANKDTKEKDKKASNVPKVAGEQRVVLAEMRCALKQPDWSHPSQHFHWDNSMPTNDSLHWGDGDLSAVSYLPPHPVKGAKGAAPEAKFNVPDNITMHVGFNIDSLR